MIKRIKSFLLSLEEYEDTKIIFNEDNLNLNLRPYKEKISLDKLQLTIDDIK